MTPLRIVERYDHRANGAVLKLKCGHEVFVGGMTTAPDAHHCGQSPCYKPERDFSR